VTCALARGGERAAVCDDGTLLCSDVPTVVCALHRPHVGFWRMTHIVLLHGRTHSAVFWIPALKCAASCETSFINTIIYCLKKDDDFFRVRVTAVSF